MRNPGAVSDSPWGEVQNTTPVTEGIEQVTTAGHGGIRVFGQTSTKLSVAAKDQAICEDGSYWFEEDCNWAIVANEFPESFSERDQELAQSSLKRWNQSYLDARK